MTPPIFEICSVDTSVVGYLGKSDRVALYPFDEAAENEPLPYATWQTVGGGPENYLGQAPDIESISIQVDVFAATASESRAIARALMSAIELHAHVTSFDGESRDAATRSYRYTFSVDWFTERS
jgi:hypothetical protein